MTTLLLESEVAKLLRCSVSTVRRLRRDGALPYLPGRPVKIRAEDVDRWIARNLQRKAAKTPKPVDPRLAALAEADRRGRMLAALIRR